MQGTGWEWKGEVRSMAMTLQVKGGKMRFLRRHRLLLMTKYHPNRLTEKARDENR
jgi:hypothetical protein